MFRKENIKSTSLNNELISLKKKSKCYPFWNDLEETVIGEFRIKATLVDNKCSYFKRKLMFRTQDSDFVREVDHYQYSVNLKINGFNDFLLF